MQKAEAEKTYDTLLHLSNQSKTWAKQVGPNAVKFLSEFVRVHKAHEANLKNLAGAADTISAIADRSAKVLKPEEGEEDGNVGSGSPAAGQAPPSGQAASKADNSESIDWAAISYCLATAATEVGQMLKTVQSSTHKKYQHMQMEQSHLQAQVERETGKVLKMRSEAKYALEQARDKKGKAQNAVERLLSSVADSSAPVAPKVRGG